MNTKESSHGPNVIKTKLLELLENTTTSSYFGKVKNMNTPYKFLFKILISCLILIERSTNQISLDHRHFLWYLVNEDDINLTAYIFHHLCEAIKESTKHKKKNVLYAILLSELFNQGFLIDSLKFVSDYEDREETHGKILVVSILDNMKLLKKSDVVLSKDPLKVKSTKIVYLEYYPMITKHDNPEVNRLYIQMDREEADVIIIYEDLQEAPTYLHKPSKKRKKVASDTQKLVQKLLKKKDVQKKKIDTEIERVVTSTILMPYKTRS